MPNPSPNARNASFETLEPRRLMSYGQLEPQFDHDGLQKIDFGGGDLARAVVIQRDNRLVLAGGMNTNFDDFAVARLNPDGSPDTTFGGDGKVTVNFGGNDTAVAAAVDASGRIVVVGHTTANAAAGSDVAVVRLDASGNPDRSFGSDGTGRVKIDFAGTHDTAAAVLINSSGKIVISGTARGSTLGDQNVALVRLNESGALDAGFGGAGTGKVVKGLLGAQSAFAMSPGGSGRILVAASTNNTTGSVEKPVVLRFNSDGTTDTSFSGDGWHTVTQFPGLTLPRGIGVDSRGRIVVGASANVGPGAANDFAAARLLADGSIDTSFGTGGVWSGSLGGAERLEAMIVQRDDKVVLAGFREHSNDSNYATVRLTSTGSPDDSYNFDGWKVLHRAGQQRGYALAQADDGSLIVAGTDDYDMGVVRYRGIFDIAFGDGGHAHQFHDSPSSGPTDDLAAVAQPADGGPIVGVGGSRIGTSSWRRPEVYRWNEDGSSVGKVAPFTFADDETDGYANAVAVQAGDGKSVVVGHSRSGLTTSVFGIARFLLNGQLDTSFAEDGTRTIDVGGTGNAVAKAVTVDGQDRVVIAGYSGNAEERRITVVRLNADGSLDATFGSGGIAHHFVLQDSHPNDVMLDAAGRIVIAGTTGIEDAGGSFTTEAFLLRLGPDGQPDYTFDGDGARVIALPGNSEGVAVRADNQGRYLLGATSEAQFTVARILPDGAIDLSFGGEGTGFSRQPARYGVSAVGMTVQRDGRLVVFGQHAAGQPRQGLVAVRWDADGTPDRTFAPMDNFGGGSVLEFDWLNRFERAGGIIATEDGDLLLAGRSGPTGSIGTPLLLKYAQPSGVVWSEFHVEKLQRVRVEFNENVSNSVQVEDFELRNLTLGEYIPTDRMAVAYSLSGNVATLSFPGYANGVLPDGEYQLYIPGGEITDSAGNEMPDHALEFFVLAGDANRDGAVDLLDFNRLAANFGQDRRTWAQGDFNYDGVVNLLDFNRLAANFGRVFTRPVELMPDEEERPERP